MKRVFNFIRRHEMIKPGQKVLVAVSGGADSVCLLHILNKIKDELQISLHIAHLNHLFGMLQELIRPLIVEIVFPEVFNQFGNSVGPSMRRRIRYGVMMIG